MSEITGLAKEGFFSRDQALYLHESLIALFLDTQPKDFYKNNKIPVQQNGVFTRLNTSYYNQNNSTLENTLAGLYNKNKNFKSFLELLGKKEDVTTIAKSIARKLYDLRLFFSKEENENKFFKVSKKEHLYGMFIPLMDPDISYNDYASNWHEEPAREVILPSPESYTSYLVFYLSSSSFTIRKILLQIAFPENEEGAIFANASWFHSDEEEGYYLSEKVEYEGMAYHTDIYIYFNLFSQSEKKHLNIIAAGQNDLKLFSSMKVVKSNIQWIPRTIRTRGISSAEAILFKISSAQLEKLKEKKGDVLSASVFSMSEEYLALCTYLRQRNATLRIDLKNITSIDGLYKDGRKYGKFLSKSAFVILHFSRSFKKPKVIQSILTIDLNLNTCLKTLFSEDLGEKREVKVKRDCFWEVSTANRNRALCVSAYDIYDEHDSNLTNFAVINLDSEEDFSKGFYSGVFCAIGNFKSKRVISNFFIAKKISFSEAGKFESESFSLDKAKSLNENDADLKGFLDHLNKITRK